LSGAATLYNREVLALAAALADWPLHDALPLRGAARSALCGSTVDLGLELDDAGRIGQIGMLVRACAIGQASAALFAKAAQGRDPAGIGDTLAQLDAWLKEAGPQPDWPGIGLLDAARTYPARHGAILLPWQAAREALSSAANPG
jgi:NifU-like protein involved in Fe-S cluster formation